MRGLPTRSYKEPEECKIGLTITILVSQSVGHGVGNGVGYEVGHEAGHGVGRWFDNRISQ